MNSPARSLLVYLTFPWCGCCWGRPDFQLICLAFLCSNRRKRWKLSMHPVRSVFQLTFLLWHSSWTPT